jgi:hypothetical protein
LDVLGDRVQVFDRVSGDIDMGAVDRDGDPVLSLLEGVVNFNIGDRRSDGRGSEEERSKSGNECGTHFLWCLVSVSESDQRFRDGLYEDFDRRRRRARLGSLKQRKKMNKKLKRRFWMPKGGHVSERNEGRRSVGGGGKE